MAILPAQFKVLFSGSSLDEPVPSKTVKDSLTPLLVNLAKQNILDIDDLPRVFVALAKPMIAILEYQSDYEDFPHANFAQPASINDIRQNWGSAVAAIRANIPLLIDVPNTTKKVLFYRAPDVDVHLDTWIDGYFSEKHGKSLSARTARRVRRISRQMIVLEQEMSDIKNMLQKMGGVLPSSKKISIDTHGEQIKVSNISPDNGYCIVTLKCGFSFRMQQNHSGRWIPCSEFQPLDECVYPEPDSLTISNVLKILSVLDDANDPHLLKFISNKPYLRSLIDDF